MMTGMRVHSLRRCRRWSLALAAALGAFLGASSASFARGEGAAGTTADVGKDAGALGGEAGSGRALTGAKVKGLCEGVADDRTQVEVVQLTFFTSPLFVRYAGKGAAPYPLLTELVDSLNRAFAEQEAKPAAEHAAGQPSVPPAPKQPAPGKAPVLSQSIKLRNPVLDQRIKLPGPNPDGTAQGAGGPAQQPEKTPPKTVIEDLGFGRLLLHGTRCQNVQIKRALARIDIPWPGVQLNMWAIQVTGKENSEVSEEVHKIREWIRQTRDRIVKVQVALKRRAAAETFPCQWQSGHEPPSFVKHATLPAGLLPDNVALLLLSLQPDGSKRVEELEPLVKELVTMPWREPDCVGCAPTRAEQRKRCRSKCAEADAGKPHSFKRLKEALEQYSYPQACDALLRFYESYHAVRALRYEDATAKSEAVQIQEERLNEVEHARDVTDRLLRALMDAFSADMEELFFDPLLDRIRAEQAKSKDGEGTALVGRNRIVVTSGLVADLSPELASYIETTPSRSFGKDLLDLLSPPKNSGKSAAGTENLLSELPQGQAALLAAALLAEPEPQYAKVAPGIAINVFPAVLPDESAARLTIDARFGVNVEALDPKARKDPWTRPPPAGVISHHVRTDVTIDVFDLFDISSFSIDVTTPQRPHLVPILSRLPILGSAFQWPLPDETMHHESIILINTVILPRSAMLTERY